MEFSGSGEVSPLQRRVRQPQLVEAEEPVYSWALATNVAIELGLRGKLADLHRAPCRAIGAELRGEHFVHLGEVGQIWHEYGDFDNALQRATRSLEDSLQIIEYGVCQDGDVTLDGVARDRVARGLPSRVNETISDDGL